MSIQNKLSKLKDQTILGMTATPDRADGCLIKFEHEINPLSRQQAVEEGWLAKTEINTIIDYNSYKEKNLSVISLLKTHREEMEGAFVFLPTLAQAVTVGKFLESVGEDVTVLNKQSNNEIHKILEDFSAKKGQRRFIINCNKLGEGIDVSGGTDAVLGRQYGSFPQINQVIGRVSRPDSDCRVWEFTNPLTESLSTLDVIGNADLHRLIYEENSVWKTGILNS